MDGSRAQLYNSITIIAVLGLCRLFWGGYQSVRIYKDIWKIIPWHSISGGKTGSKHSVIYDIGLHPHFEDMRVSGEGNLPLWPVRIYLRSNMILAVLNFY